MRLALSWLRMPKRQSGFTLIEMMIVVSVMGTMAALLAPGLTEFLADSRAGAAAEDLVRLSRVMRARSQSLGLAHLLVFSATAEDSGELGRILVYEGMNNHCRQTPWPQTINGTVANGHVPVDRLDMRLPAYNPVSQGTQPTAGDRGRHVIRLQAFNAAGETLEAMVLCYEPSGTTWQGTGDESSTGFTFILQTQPARFTISRRMSGEARGMTRQVIFQPSGVARFRY